jgi:hypothetical protein
MLRSLMLMTLTKEHGGNESDYTLSLKALDRFLKAARENDLQIRITVFVGDCHYDFYAHYDYLEQKEVIPVILLSESSQKSYPHLLDHRGIRLDTDGTPLCPRGLRMRHHQYKRIKKAHVFTFPIERDTHRGGKSIYIAHRDECPLQKICDPEKILSPMHTIKSSTNPRLYPPIARTSPRFQQLMNQSSAPERYNAVIDSTRLERAAETLIMDSSAWLSWASWSTP